MKGKTARDEAGSVPAARALKKPGASRCRNGLCKRSNARLAMLPISHPRITLCSQAANLLHPSTSIHNMLHITYLGVAGRGARDALRQEGQRHRVAAREARVRLRHRAPAVAPDPGVLQQLRDGGPAGRAAVQMAVWVCAVQVSGSSVCSQRVRVWHWQAGAVRAVLCGTRWGRVSLWHGLWRPPTASSCCKHLPEANRPTRHQLASTCKERKHTRGHATCPAHTHSSLTLLSHTIMYTSRSRSTHLCVGSRTSTERMKSTASRDR